MSPLFIASARYVLKLVDPFGISRITRTEEERIYLAVDGGLGEAAPVSYYGEDEETVARTLQAIGQMDFDDLDLVEQAMELVASRITKNRAAKAAFDMALHDRLGKKLGIPVWKLFGRKPTHPLVTSFTIGIDTLEVMLEKVERARRYDILKIKLGRDVKHDLEVMREIRALVGPSKSLRVDANAGWSLDDARRVIPVLADLGVEFVEQPLRMGAYEELRELRKDCPLPIILDEDVHTARDIPRLAALTDGINIKLMKSGGLLEARRMIAVAQAHGLRTMLGCMIESSLGITAAAQLAPAVDYLDLDGNLLIANDPFSGVRCDPNGTLHLSQNPGLGVIVRPEYQEDLKPILSNH